MVVTLLIPIHQQLLNSSKQLPKKREEKCATRQHAVNVESLPGLDAETILRLLSKVSQSHSAAKDIRMNRKSQDSSARFLEKNNDNCCRTMED
jgi:hypothetical protein